MKSDPSSGHDRHAILNPVLMGLVSNRLARKRSGLELDI